MLMVRLRLRTMQEAADSIPYLLGKNRACLWKNRPLAVLERRPGLFGLVTQPTDRL